MIFVLCHLITGKQKHPSKKECIIRYICIVLGSHEKLIILVLKIIKYNVIILKWLFLYKFK